MARQSVLSGMDWSGLEAVVERQQRRREVDRPTISDFRWWARRSSTLMGSIIDAAAEGVPGPMSISDPFSGGGTVAVEALLRGHNVYAQDLNPWAITGLRVSTMPVDAEAFRAAADAVLDELDRGSDSYAATCELHEHSITSATFRVRVVKCTGCSEDVFAFPYGMVTLASRNSAETHGFFGCTGCGEVTRSSLSASDRRCRSCRRRLAPPHQQLQPGRKMTCPHCHCDFNVLDHQMARWKVTLIRRACVDANGKRIRHFAYPRTTDLARAAVSTCPYLGPLAENIPDGIETRILRRAGFRTWADLFPNRQLMALLQAADLCSTVQDDAHIRERLLLGVAGAFEMAGHLCRWDRLYPKAFEAMANHRFAPVGFACEINLLGSDGRGTLRHRLDNLYRSANWLRKHQPTKRSRPDQFVCGSSEVQQARDGQIDLILTDPPYLGAVQYGELAKLLVVSADRTGLIPARTRPDSSAEAVSNRVRGQGYQEYQAILTSVFKESARTLKAEGRMILTFRHNDLRAWFALATALRTAGFFVTHTAVVHAENSSDFSKQKDGSFTKDLLIECLLEPMNDADPSMPESFTDAQSTELALAGALLRSCRCETYSDARTYWRSVTGGETTWISAPNAGEIR